MLKRAKHIKLKHIKMYKYKLEKQMWKQRKGHKKYSIVTEL